MTIAITLKVNEGLVFATDSASTIMRGTEIINVYNNANKIFNLVKGLHLGVMVWGAGSIGAMTITDLLKELRVRLGDTQNPAWYVDPQNYQVADVAQKFVDFVHQEKYLHHYGNLQGAKPSVGFVVGGYSTGNDMAEQYRVMIDEAGNCAGPIALRALEDTGANWYGQPEALDRLVLGYSKGVPKILKHVAIANVPVPVDNPEDPAAGAAAALAHGQAVAAQEAGVDQIFQLLEPILRSPVDNDLMPIQDAIDLAEFMVDLTIKYTRFMPGSPTVGGPIEIATITRHEGFKWIRRKHYFDDRLNPQGR